MTNNLYIYLYIYIYYAWVFVYYTNHYNCVNIDKYRYVSLTVHVNRFLVRDYLITYTLHGIHEYYVIWAWLEVVRISAPLLQVGY